MLHSSVLPAPNDDPLASPTPVERPLGSARSLTRIWGKGSAAQVGIADVDLDIARGEVLAIVGPSGSGKSTLGALLAGIDKPTSGSLVVDGQRIDQMKPDALADWRSRRVGIVFQSFHLLPTLTAVENVELSLELGRERPKRRARHRAALDSLDLVGMRSSHRKLPTQLSGGEQQRVGIARAVVTKPSFIVADEPTGALDQANGHTIMRLLTGLADAGTTVVFITHDMELAAAADRIVRMVDGRIDSIARGGRS